MQTVESSLEIRAELDRVYELAKDISLFSQCMPDIRSINVLERSEDGSRVISEWIGVVREFRAVVRWTVEDTWDDEAKTCKFSVVNRDRVKYCGAWTFTDLGDRVRLDGIIEAECSIRRLGSSIERLMAAKIRRNTSGLLAAIKAKAEQ